MKLALIALVAACTPSYDQQTAAARSRGDRDRETAYQRWRTAHPASSPVTEQAIQLAPSTPATAVEPGHGLQAGEVIYAAPSGQLAFVGLDCSNACNCDVPTAYHLFAEPNGRVAIVRLRADGKTHYVDFETCANGCGQGMQPIPQPPMPIAAWALGATSVDQIDIVDIPYHYDFIKKRCKRTIEPP